MKTKIAFTFGVLFVLCLLFTVSIAVYDVSFDIVGELYHLHKRIAACLFIAAIWFGILSVGIGIWGWE